MSAYPPAMASLDKGDQMVGLLYRGGTLRRCRAGKHTNPPVSRPYEKHMPKKCAARRAPGMDFAAGARKLLQNCSREHCTRICRACGGAPSAATPARRARTPGAGARSPRRGAQRRPIAEVPRRRGPTATHCGTTRCCAKRHGVAPPDMCLTNTRARRHTRRQKPAWPPNASAARSDAVGRRRAHRPPKSAFIRQPLILGTPKQELFARLRPFGRRGWMFGDQAELDIDATRLSNVCARMLSDRRVDDVCSSVASLVIGVVSRKSED